MRAFLSRLTIMVLVFLLGMPAGWCCVPGGNQSACDLDGVRACCAHQLPQPPTEERPVTPDAECCCVLNVPVSTPVAEIVDTSNDVADYDISLDDFRPGFSSSIFVMHSAFEIRPRTHLLQCVWLC